MALGRESQRSQALVGMDHGSATRTGAEDKGALTMVHGAGVT